LCGRGGRRSGPHTAALDTTAGERERGSLEPLLTTPATRVGLVVGNFMPSDRLRDRDRWGLSAQHQQALPLGGGLALNFNRVSDANYWRDFTRGIAPLTQRLLPGDARLAWSGNGWDAQLRTLKWQTLQDVAAPIVPPYDRLPQLAVRYGVAAPRGWQYGIDLDHTRFRADALLTGQPKAQRSVLNARASYTWATPGSFLTPALRLSAARYAFDAPLANGSSRASRSVPSFSLDGGLVFERDTTYFGRAVRQTLEPRAFYTYTPYRDQSRIPIYDTAAKDFNFDSIFSDNPYVGNDRVADNNLLTLGLTSRLFDPATGGEAVRLGVAQRFRFTDQRVTLPGVAPVSERLSDMLFGGSVNWSASWRADASLQFNPKTGRSLRTTLGGRYSPGPYRVVNASYRLQNGVSELLDVGWQWPINDLWGDRGLDLGAGRGQGPGRWYSVGRLNYSLMDRKLVDTILGVEYDAGCWIGRIVFDRLQSGAATSSSRIMFQLEFVGFSRLGSNPLKTLRDNIPRYQYLREQTLPPSRFSNYD
jgi:LPS-assembly protein